MNKFMAFLKELNLKEQLKNSYFWLGIIGTLFAAANIDFNTLTNWKLLLDAIKSIFANPVALVSVLMCFIGITNNNADNIKSRKGNVNVKK